MDDNQILAGRAVDYRQQILDVAMGPGGMLVAFCYFDTRRPFQEGDDLHWYLHNILDGVWGGNSPKPTVAEWYYGENTLWATGLLLYSQILRYRATQDPEARETARKCFRDLNNIFRLCRALQPGLLGKPHGGRAGDTTSYDQAACPVLFYTLYAQELATPEEKAEAQMNMALHGDYYLRRNWVMNHHGNFARIVDPAHTSAMKYLACVHAAYELTGETRFRDAAFKYLRQIMQLGRLPWATNPYEINHNLFYWGLLCDYWSKTEIAGETDFIHCIREYWLAAKAAVNEEGILRAGPYDTATRIFTPYPDKWVTPEDVQRLGTLDTGERRVKRRWVSATCYGNSPLNAGCFAALGLLARSHGLDDQAHTLSKRSLMRLDPDTIRYWFDDGKLPDELKFMHNIFAPEVPAMWLVAYWTGRLQGVW
ncbi:MAG: hypothetical protein HY326_06990 [Chloroflexi bacterium]|nr:hypothetical protein [Chloroflexota bacterium]